MKTDRVVIAFLRKHKGIPNQLDKIFGYKDTAAHWFTKGFSFPTVDDWIKLKAILYFDEY